MAKCESLEIKELFHVGDIETVLACLEEPDPAIKYGGVWEVYKDAEFLIKVVVSGIALGTPTQFIDGKRKVGIRVVGIVDKNLFDFTKNMTLKQKSDLG